MLLPLVRSVLTGALDDDFVAAVVVGELVSAEVVVSGSACWKIQVRIVF